MSNEVATSDLPGSFDDLKQASYRDSNDNTARNDNTAGNDNTAPNDIGEPPYSDDDLLQSLPPILDQLEGHAPGRYTYFQTLMHADCASRLGGPRKITFLSCSSKR